jgi:hypothetical protein
MPRQSKPFLPADADPPLLAVYRRLAAREVVARERLFRSIPSRAVNAIPGPEGVPLPSGTVRMWRRRAQIFAFRHQRRDFFPLFQFERGSCKPLIQDILRVLRPSDGWYAMFWFAGANAWLEDRSPMDVMDEDAHAVLEAAAHSHDRISD